MYDVGKGSFLGIEPGIVRNEVHEEFSIFTLTLSLRQTVQIAFANVQT